jgi:hypothetical protein
VIESASKKYAIQKFLVDEANRQGIDPALALAIAKVESDFNPQAVSHVGATGIMQIMPATAKGVFGISPERLFDAQTNIELGLRFIKKLLIRYDQRTDIALSHYNGGSAVRNTQGGLTVIPATQKYVDKVLSAQANFKYKAYQLSDAPVNTPLESSYIARKSTQQSTMQPTLQPKYQHVGFRSVANSQKVKMAKAAQESKKSVKLEGFLPTESLEQEFEQPLYDKVEQLRTLRLHNIMRNTQSHIPESYASKSYTSKGYISKGTAIEKISPYYAVNTLSQPKRQSLPKQAIPLSEKRLKVLRWEKMFN